MTKRAPGLPPANDAGSRTIEVATTVLGVPSGLWPWLGGGIAVLFAFLFLRPFAIVNAGQRGVILQFGKVSDTILDEGIHPIVPVVARVQPVSVRVRKTDLQAQASSKDLQSITAEIALNWHVDPNRVNRVYQQLGDEDQIVNSIINPAISEVLKAATAKKTAVQIITERTELKDEVDKTLAARLADYGLIVDDVSLVNFSFSPEFARAIEAKQIAEQEAKQAEFVALKATKDAEATINRAKGQAEAQRLLRQSLTKEILQKQAIDKWDGKFPVVMGGSGALPFINLDLTQPDAKQP